MLNTLTRWYRIAEDEETSSYLRLIFTHYLLNEADHRQFLIESRTMDELVLNVLQVQVSVFFNNFPYPLLTEQGFEETIELTSECSTYKDSFGHKLTCGIDFGLFLDDLSPVVLNDFAKSTVHESIGLIHHKKTDAAQEDGVLPPEPLQTFWCCNKDVHSLFHFLLFQHEFSRI